MASILQQTSRLPQPAKAKVVAKSVNTRSRGILGDIKNVKNQDVQNEKNPTTKKLVLAGGKTRMTRQASRRLVPLAVEAKEDAALASTQERVLPPGVVDVDSKDASNPQLCAEYAAEMFAYLKEREAGSAVRPLHLAGCPTNERMRGVLVDWMVEVQVQFRLLQETLFIAVDIMDRYLAIEGKTVTRSKLQLVGVGCLFLAAKVEEVYAPAVADFVYITDNAYSEAEIKAMEIKILRLLNFDLFQPVSLHFLRRFSRAGDVDVLQHGLAKFAIEASLLEYQLVAAAGSLVAAAGLYMALMVLEGEAGSAGVWTTSLAFHTGYTRDQLLPTVSRLAKTITGLAAKTNKLVAIRAKYQGGKFHGVADLPELQGEVMTRLANMKL